MMVAARQACFQDGENECKNSTALVNTMPMTITSLTLEVTFYSNFQKPTDQPSWSTDKANPVSAAFMPLIHHRRDRGRWGRGSYGGRYAGGKVDEVEYVNATRIEQKQMKS
jgi:hypothetical protein